MKILTTRAIYKELGIDKPQPSEKHTINIRFWLVLFDIVLSNVLIFLGLVLEVKNIEEFADCFYALCVSIAGFAFFSILCVFITSNLFTLLEDLEALIANSKYLVSLTLRGQNGFQNWCESFFLSQTIEGNNFYSLCRNKQ